ncbi:MAG: hypothetical protein ACXWIG_04215 [Caldimonas sp.]
MNRLLASNPLLRHGVLGGAAMAAVILLCVFYSVVAAAVDRAAARRIAQTTTEPGAVVVRRTAPRALIAVDQRSAMASHLGPRTVSYVRRGN